MKRMPLLAVIAAGLAALSLGLSACGDDDSSSAGDTTTAAATTAPPAATTAPPAATTAPASTASSTAAAPIALDADPSGALKYTQTALTAKAGAVDIAFTNDSEVPHDVTIEGKGSSEVISGGKTSDLKITNLPAGTYTFFCSVPGHEQAGMKGTLTVN